MLDVVEYEYENSPRLMDAVAADGTDVEFRRVADVAMGLCVAIGAICGQNSYIIFNHSNKTHPRYQS